MEAWPEDRVRKVRDGVVERRQGEEPRCLAPAESGQLGKDEPHPVGPFASRGQLVEGAGEGAVVVLGVNEALKIGAVM